MDGRLLVRRVLGLVRRLWRLARLPHLGQSRRHGAPRAGAGSGAAGHAAGDAVVRYGGGDVARGPNRGSFAGNIGEGARNAFWKLQGYTGAIMVAGLGCFLVPAMAIWRDERRRKSENRGSA